MADVLSDYLGELNEDLIKDNFIIVYEVIVLIYFLLLIFYFILFFFWLMWSVYIHSEDLFWSNVSKLPTKPTSKPNCLCPRAL